MEYLVFDSNVSQRWRRVKEFIESMTDANFWIDIKKHTRCLLKDTMELCMDWEMTQYVANELYKRTNPRTDSRNGYYYRNLDTELGPIDELRVPRSRLGLFETNVFRGSLSTCIVISVFSIFDLTFYEKIGVLPLY